MEYLVTTQEMQQADHNTIERIGIPSMVLMERAAYTVWEEIQKRNIEGDRRVLILAGCGNNGADGLALARMLVDSGYEVEVVCCGNQERASEQWKQQKIILQNYPIKLVSKPQSAEYNIMIDALFGVGLSREVQGEYAKRIEEFNHCKGYKIAVDVPSGIHSDNGWILGCGVKVDLTVTFAYAKRGLYLYPGAEYAGEIVCRDIGIRERSFLGRMPEMFRYTEQPEALLPKRISNGNKGTFGKVLLIAGNEKMAGAAVLAARSAGRIGAGMVKVLTPECNRGIVSSSMPEALIATAEEVEEALKWADVAAIGPGLGTDDYGKRLLHHVITESRLPLVIDADGLNILATNPKLVEELIVQGEAGRTIIMTPHMGELSRLTGTGIQKLKENITEYTKGLAQRWNCVIVSKDARTLICGADGRVCLNTTGNSGMATAGSGDVLSGVITGLLAQGMTGFEAAAIGVYLHGLAGDKAAEMLGEYAVLAGDIVQGLTR